MKTLLILLVALFAGPASGPQECRWSSAITVYVVNRSFADIRISFGSYSQRKTADGNRTTTFRGVPRTELERGVVWRVVRGGMNQGLVSTSGASPMCDKATLLVLPGAVSGIVFGADVRRKIR